MNWKHGFLFASFLSGVTAATMLVLYGLYALSIYWFGVVWPGGIVLLLLMFCVVVLSEASRS